MSDSISELETLRARRTAAEDTHGRVFFSVTRVLNETPAGAELVKAWLSTYRQMETLRKQERDLIEHGRIIADGPDDPFGKAGATEH